MAALGWLLDLDFAGGDGSVVVDTADVTQNMMRNARGMKPGSPMSLIWRVEWLTLTFLSLF